MNLAYSMITVLSAINGSAHNGRGDYEFNKSQNHE